MLDSVRKARRTQHLMKDGIMVTKQEAMEALPQVRTVLLDKGTITTGSYAVSDWILPEDASLRRVKQDEQQGAPDASLRQLLECTWLTTHGQPLREGE
eukprot:5888427-Amphidinium_carterae.1